MAEIRVAEREPLLGEEQQTFQVPCLPPGIQRQIRHLILEAYNVVAAAAKLLQLCPTLCDPTDGSP